ncbi:MAG: UDP-N-acetylglucosamine 2-epimerase (hydrolyzing) [Candidatus Sungbacteria bacterium]|nr:UDP-N-acetylglucosamine 2-epimerase (hydrolyzing) [Candidatus Sungbacteria bacterium]
MKKGKRKICFPITSRVHYARQKLLLEKMLHHKDIDLQLVAGGSVLIDKYGERFLPAMEKAGFKISDVLYNVIEGGHHVAMARTAGLTALEFSNSLDRLKSDIVLIRGDRFEQLALAMTAAYLNKTIAHIEGGDLSGTIDESVRHAITKLSHIHFVTNEDSRRRVIQMGEHPEYVFNVGSLDIEFVASISKKNKGEVVNAAGVGAHIDVAKPFLVVMQHPVTTEKNNQENAEELFKVIDELKMPTAWFWPNSDAGTHEIAKVIRVWRERVGSENHHIRFVTDLLPEDFIGLLRSAKCLIGNSSSGIKECSYLGTPVVNIGTRQQNRLRGPNVLDVGHRKQEIKGAILRQLEHGRYPPAILYHQAKTSEKIAKVLARATLQIQKNFFEAKEI